LSDNIGLRNEIEYFPYAKWPVDLISDPKDSCASRYAVVSAILALFVEAFNQRIELGLSRKADPIMTREEIEQYQKEERIFELVLDWTKHVAPLEETLVIPHENDEVIESLEDVRASSQLAANNILHWQPPPLHLENVSLGLSLRAGHVVRVAFSDICLHSAKFDGDRVFVLSSRSTRRNSCVDDKGFFCAISIAFRGYLAPKSMP
jgi:hypothetical protein